jgi:pyrimidine operon attenuation protein/uracil phosphoribosyltransferase
MNKDRVQIMDYVQIGQKLKRMAHEILENHYREKEVVIVGIDGRGKKMAALLSKELEAIAPFVLVKEEIALDKEKPLSSPVSYTGDVKALKGKAIILIDDVLNSGKTLIYASRFLLDADPKSLAICVLVDRFHRRFPIRADYVGLSLSTNMKEHVQVELEGKSGAVYLHS